MAENLIVCDVDYDVLACEILDYWRDEDKVLKKLISILSNVYEHGIAQGDAHDSIGILKEEIETIYRCAQGQGESVYKTVLSYLDRIDEIDLKLYGN